MKKIIGKKCRGICKTAQESNKEEMDKKIEELLKDLVLHPGRAKL